MTTANEQPPQSEPVWTYRGYQLRASEFTTAMVHFFRAEVTRANVWRQRLDTTTNWAVVTTGAALSFSFTQAKSGHVVILLDLLLVTVFLYMEARRYRYYELWAYRVRLMETDFFASMLVPPFHPAADWAESLADSLLMPNFPISGWEAFGRRLRRNYILIYFIIGLSWLSNLWLIPTSVNSAQEFFSRAAMGNLPGPAVFIIVGIFFATMLIIAIATIGLHKTAGEVLPFITTPRALSVAGEKGSKRAWFRPQAKRQQLLTLIVTGNPDLVCKKIIEMLGRGATIMAGKGAYTGQERSILLIALTVTEIPQLKALLAETDPESFVIVSPAQSIFGKGFMPLKER